MIRLMHGDCLEKMGGIGDGSVDMVMTDPPYGTTACKWDSVIPFEPMWAHLKRVIKPRGAIVLTTQEPFTSALISSNIKMFKYRWVWQKDNGSNFFAAKFMPLNDVEDVPVFSFGGINNGCKIPMAYNPQGIQSVCRTRINASGVGGKVGENRKTSMKGGVSYQQMTTGYPGMILRLQRDGNHEHPTQKPVALMEYLIKTYTLEGETVLDFTMGSGTTGVAAKQTGRSFIGIELDPEYFKIAKGRIENAAQQFELF